MPLTEMPYVAAAMASSIVTCPGAGGEDILSINAPEEPGAIPEWQRLVPPPRQPAGRAWAESGPPGGQVGGATPEAGAPAAAAGATTTPAASARARMFPAHIAAGYSGVPEGQPLVSPDVKREELLARRSADMMSQVAQQVCAALSTHLRSCSAMHASMPCNAVCSMTSACSA